MVLAFANNDCDFMPDQSQNLSYLRASTICALGEDITKSAKLKPIKNCDLKRIITNNIEVFAPKLWFYICFLEY